jgi:2-polyprenyl-3-methyl-5-hydroxy-6-metoxy-1,4-benzoquinol methylase
MPNANILRAVADTWSGEESPGRRLLDLSCGDGHTSRLLAEKAAFVVATEYEPFASLGEKILSVAGVDLNDPLPFKDAAFDGANITEVIEHVEHQAQLIREISRIVREEGVVVISTPNVLNVLSRLPFFLPAFCAAASDRRTIAGGRGRRRISICSISTSFTISYFTTALTSNKSGRRK